MPVCGHWRGLRHYDRCFTASQAVDWLHRHLRHDTNFGATVSRDQTIKLLRKFVKAGLIEDVRGSTATASQDDFRDSRELYRFSSRSPLKALRTPRTPGRPPLAPLNNNNNNNKSEDDDDGASPVLRRRLAGSLRESARSKGRAGPSDAGENAANERRDQGRRGGELQQCHLVARSLTKEESDDVWRRVFLEELDQTTQHLLYSPWTMVVPPGAVSGETVRHNMTQVSGRGVVTLATHHSDPLPPWVITAMRCLADWPNMSDPSVNVPDYPGVERDVFTILRDYYTNLVEPLIPYELYDAVVRLYIGAEFLDISIRSHSPNPSSCPTPENQDHSGDVDFDDSDSVDDLMLNMSIGGGGGTQQKTSTPNVGTEDAQRCGTLGRVGHCTSRMPSLGRNVALSASKTPSLNGNVARNSKTPLLNENMAFSASKTPSRSGNVAVSTPHTPSLSRNVALNVSRLQSLKLRRLKDYTHFKDDSLYHALGGSMAGSEEDIMVSRQGRELLAGPPPEDQENMRPQNQTAGQTRQGETVRSIKTNDQVRRLRRDEAKCRASDGDQSRGPWGQVGEPGQGREGQAGVWPPQNCCFETAFTSDSPQTRIIPQKSVDSLHMGVARRNPAGAGAGAMRLRPRSIAATTLATSDPQPATTPREVSNLSTVSDLFKSSIMSWASADHPDSSGLDRSRYITALEPSPHTLDRSTYLSALERSPLNRSRSAGNLDSLGQGRASPVAQVTSSERDLTRPAAPARSLATRIRDSIKRKHIRDDSLSRRRNSRVAQDMALDRLRTRSGGFINLALAPATGPHDDTDSLDSGVCEGRVETCHLRTKSGGFLNLALAPSSDSVDTGPLSSRSDSAVLDRPAPSHSRVMDSLNNPASLTTSALGHPRLTKLSLGHPSQGQIRAASPIGPDLSHRRLTTPDGCLSHSLSSSRCSVYHSALGHSTSPWDTHTLTGSTSAGPWPLATIPPNPPLPPRLARPAAKMAPAQMTSATADYVNMAPDPDPDPPVPPWPPRSPHPYTRLAPHHPHASPSLRLIGRRTGSRVGERFPGSRACMPGLLTREGREAAVSSLRLLLLLLPPPLRRSLHLLLRVCSKMAANERLQLDPHLTTRALALGTFLRGVLLAPCEADYDEILCLRVLSFLVDHHQAILRPPDHLAVLVHRTLQRLQRLQITPGDYERQKLSGSQLFLAELLDQIVGNEKLSAKERKRKLKEFKSLYPDVYKARFPSVPAKREGRMKGLMKLASLSSLGRNKAIRM